MKNKVFSHAAVIEVDDDMLQKCYNSCNSLLDKHVQTTTDEDKKNIETAIKTIEEVV